MARKGGSFQFAKRQKELKKQKKRQEKLERKRGGGSSDAEVLSDDSPEATQEPSAETKTDPEG